MDLKEVWWKVVGSIELAEGREHLWACTNTVMKYQVMANRGLVSVSGRTVPLCCWFISYTYQAPCVCKLIIFLSWILALRFNYSASN